MTNLIKSSLDTLPTPIPVALLTDLRSLTNRLVKSGEHGGPVEIDVKPSPDVVASLQNRVARISNWMMPAGPENTLKELAKLFATMGIRSAGDDERKMAVRVYVEDLMDLPLYALIAACKAFRSGQAGSGTWAPTQAEIRSEATKAMAPMIKERRDIEAVLNAEVRVPTDSTEHRKAVVEKVRESIKAMRDAGRDAEVHRSGRAHVEPPKPETPLETLERLKGQPLPQLSPELRAKYVTATTTHHEAAE